MPLTADALRAWLKNLPPNQWVGHPRSPVCCTLANYLNSFGVGTWWTNEKILSCIDDKCRQTQAVLTPTWAKRFIERHDASRGEITARRALKILDEIQNPVRQHDR